MSQNFYSELFDIIKVSMLRRELAKRDHRLFFSFYLNQYLEFDVAPLHHDFFDLTNNLPKILALSAFRGCGKSTIFSTSLPMWAVMGRLKKKFVLIGSKTMDQAGEIIKNIKTEIEDNTLLKKDMGPFSERREWNGYSLVFEKYKAKITAISVGDSIRGLRFMEHRPDLIILDDLDDLASVQNFDQRESLANWFTGEILPIGDHKTNIVLIGNVLHEDCLMSRWKKKASENEIIGLAYKEYPLLDETGKSIWPSRYPDQQSIDQLRIKMGHVAFAREYMLQIIPDGSRLIWPEWIEYYDQLPPLDYKNGFQCGIVAVDFATGGSSDPRRDYSAIVSGYIFGQGKDRRFYILPNPINTKDPLEDVLNQIEAKANTIVPGSKSHIVAEKNGFQTILTPMLRKRDLSVKSVTHKINKWQRLSLISPLIQNGKVFFPRTGCQTLLDQLLNFGSTQHDDLADAFTMLLEEAPKFGSLNVTSGNLRIMDRPMTYAEIEAEKTRLAYERKMRLIKMNDEGYFLR